MFPVIFDKLAKTIAVQVQRKFYTHPKILFHCIQMKFYIESMFSVKHCDCNKMLNKFSVSYFIHIHEETIDTTFLFHLQKTKEHKYSKIIDHSYFKSLLIRPPVYYSRKHGVVGNGSARVAICPLRPKHPQ